MAALNKEKRALEKKLGRKIETWYAPGALKKTYGQAWYPGLEYDVMQGIVTDPRSAALAQEQRQANNIPADQPMNKPLTAKEKAFGTPDQMKTLLEGTPEQRQYRRDMLGFLSGPEGQTGYLQNALQQLQQQAQPTQAEQQYEQQYANLMPYLAQQIQAVNMGAQFPDQLQNLPHPQSMGVQQNMPSAYGYQPQPQSDFQHLMGQAQQYAPQIGQALAQGWEQYGPGIQQWAQQYAPQARQSQFGPALQAAGSGMWNALGNLFKKQG